MSLDREQIDAIKAHFLRQFSTKLRTILESNDEKTWSPEAFAAAREILDDRAAGRAAEPTEAPPELMPLRSRHTVESIALTAGLILSGVPLGWLFLQGGSSYLEGVAPGNDEPRPFGSGIAWLALATTDTARVTKALDLRGVREANWKNGVDAAYKSSVFVTPPLGDWTLVAGHTFFPLKEVGTFVKSLLEFLSERFGEAQYFCTKREVELHVWGRAQRGRLRRGFGWLGQQQQQLWDHGSPSREERELGFRFVDAQPVAEPRDDDRLVPTEKCVMELASLWSIDPTSIDEQFLDPLTTGLLGDPPWIEGSSE